jgi:hypothetical protein
MEIARLDGERETFPAHVSKSCRIYVICTGGQWPSLLTVTEAKEIVSVTYYRYMGILYRFSIRYCNGNKLFVTKC